MKKTGISTLFCLCAMAVSAIGVSGSIRSSSSSAVSVKADGVSESIGKIAFASFGNNATSFYAGCETAPASITANWSSAYVGTANYVASSFSGDYSIQLKYCKVDAKRMFYVEMTGYGANNATPAENDTVTISGNYTDATTGNTFVISESILTYNYGTWAKAYSDDELETYDVATLRDIGMGESMTFTSAFHSDNVATNVHNVNVSATNTTNSLVLKFDATFPEYQSDRATDYDHIEIRLRGSGPWKGYHFFLGPNWGKQGVALVKIDDGANLTPDGDTNLAGGPHHLEFGSIDIKGTDNTWLYIKNDGQMILSATTSSVEAYKTARVGFSVTTCSESLPVTVTSTGDSYLNDSGIVLHPALYNPAGDSNGVYFKDAANVLPYSEWNIKSYGYEADSISINGQGIIRLGTATTALVKFGEETYYLALRDSGYSAGEGDIVVVDGYFSSYDTATSKKYIFRVAETGFLHEGNAFYAIEDTREYLKSKLSSFIDPTDYSSDDAEAIETLINTVSAEIVSAKKFTDAYKVYSSAIVALDAFDVDPEKLEQLKAAAITEISAYADESNYAAEQVAELHQIIADATEAINAATSKTAINEALATAKAKIDALKTIGDYAEEKIAAQEEGYEQYLDAYDVVSLNDLAWGNELKYYDSDTVDNNLSVDGGAAIAQNTFSASEDNPNGNVIFQFGYESTSTAGGKYGAQAFLRLRGVQYFSYRFDMGITDGGVRCLRMESDSSVKVLQTVTNVFEANVKYNVQIGAIDVSRSNDVWMFCRVNGTLVLSAFCERISWATNARVSTSDSFTTDGAVLTLSDIREGTTTESHSILSSRATMSTAYTSDLNGVYFEMPENDLPYSGWDYISYAMSADCITVNGTPVANSGVKAISKFDATHYYLALKDQGITVNDGDQVNVKGCFYTFDDSDSSKTVFTIRETIFVYESGSWKQEITLEAAKEDAVMEIRAYRDASLYDSENQAKLADAVEKAVAAINAATTKEEVASALAAGKAAIDAIPTLLMQHKDEAKEIVSAYKSESLSDYRAEQQQEIALIKSAACDAIDQATTFAAVDKAVNDAKSAIDEVKTAAEMDAIELAEHKVSAKKEVEDYYNALNLDNYTDENIEILNGLVVSAKADIDAATSIDDINAIVLQFKADVDAVPVKKARKAGCGGSVLATSGLLALLSLSGIVLLKKKNK